MSTLQELRNRVRIRADAVGNNFFADAEIDTYINTGLGELHDILVLAFEDYYVKSVEFSTVSGTSNYLFSAINASDFYKCLGVDATDTGETLRVRRFSFQDRNKFASNDMLTGRGDYTDFQYQVRGNSIEIIPSPTSVTALKLWYIPAYTVLTANGDNVDSRVMSNWEEYAVLMAVLKMKEKEELSTTSLEREIKDLRDRIEAATVNRDAGEPFGITDELTGVEIGVLGR